MLWTVTLRLLEQCTSGWLALEWWCPQPALIGICVEVLWNSWARRSLDFALVAARSRRHSKKAVHTRSNLKRLLTNQSAIFRCAVWHCSGSVCGLIPFCQEPFQSLNGRLLDAVQAGLVKRAWQAAIFWMMEAGIVDLSAVELFGAEEMLCGLLLPCELSTCGYQL